MIVDLPMIGDELTDAWQLASSNLEGFLGQYGRPIVSVGEWTLHAVAGLAGSVVLVLAAVIISGFLYGPAPRLTAGVRRFAERVVGPRGSAFVDLAGVTIRNVARGVIGVALIQALLIGFGLIVAEVPAAGLLTLAVLVLGILQVGAAPVVIPLLIWVWATRDTTPALLLTLYLIPAMLADNALEAAADAQGARDAGAGDPRRGDRRHDLLRADRAVPRAGGAGGLLRPAAVLDGRGPVLPERPGGID